MQGVSELGGGIREGRRSSVEAVGAALAAIDAWSLRDGAFLAVDREGALAAARRRTRAVRPGAAGR